MVTFIFFSEATIAIPDVFKMKTNNIKVPIVVFIHLSCTAVVLRKTFIAIASRVCLLYTSRCV